MWSTQWTIGIPQVFTWYQNEIICSIISFVPSTVVVYIYSHIKMFNKNNKLIAIIYPLITCYRSLRPCALCFTLSELLCTLLGWFQDHISHHVFPSLWFLEYFYFLWCEKYDGNLQFRAYLNIMSTWGLCICFYLLPEEASTMKTRYDTDLWVYHIIHRN